ncbi:alkaline phosphatase [Conexibacter sp. SYSU D00693]|uniref:alkaline phosphatase D family protein n=1 Tax=Conexibacter sp. SYSU D00693 TaxID=2812560 RepID=UPI00196B910C|nr:alkaline phosphatase D family protein [Conexibacter sp. SYSU D00693]
MPTTRRQALSAAVAFAATGTLPSTAVAAARRREPLLRRGTFGSGVASGLPAPQGATVWTRVGGLGDREAGKVRVELARDPDFRQTITRFTARAAPVRDHVVRVDVGRHLRPGERAWYRFSTATGSSPVGRLTVPRPADSREPVRIGFFSCQDFTHGTYAAHAGLAQEDLDLVVCLGDYVYERDGQGQVEGRDVRVSAGEDGQVETLAEYRALYRRYRSDPQLQAMHAAHPFLAIWDDHEAANDYDGEQGPARRVPFSQRRRNGYLAWFEWMPFAPLVDDRFRIFRTLSLGAHADLLLLDGRQHRDRARGTMLGDAQRTWLLEQLQTSRASWRIVANQTMCMANDLLPGRTNDTDGWDGFARERRTILETVKAKGVQDVVLATGDEHEFYAGTVSPTGRVDAPAVATEVVAGAISSSAEAPGADRAVAAGAIELQAVANPHWAYADGARQGYGVFEAREDALRVRLRGPREVTDARSPTVTHATLTIPRGTPRVLVD